MGSFNSFSPACIFLLALIVLSVSFFMCLFNFLFFFDLTFSASADGSSIGAYTKWYCENDDLVGAVISAKSRNPAKKSSGSRNDGLGLPENLRKRQLNIVDCIAVLLNYSHAHVKLVTCSIVYRDIISY